MYNIVQQEGAVSTTYDPIGEELAKLSPREQETVAAGAAQWKELGTGAHLQQWLRLQPGLLILRRIAMRRSNSNRPIGVRYTEQFRLLMQRAGFTGLQPNEAKQQTDQITALLWLAEPLQPGEPQARMERLESLLAKTALLERARLNMPTSARAKVTDSFREEREAKERAATGLPPPDEPAERTSKLKQTEHSLAQALQRVHQLEEQLKRKEDGSLFDLKHDSTDDIVATIAANISTHKAEAIAKGLLVQVKRKRQQPAG
jgi:flagellar motility protein MotE (MotC chaperone)